MDPNSKKVDNVLINLPTEEEVDSEKAHEKSRLQGESGRLETEIEMNPEIKRLRETVRDATKRRRETGGHLSEQEVQASLAIDDHPLVKTRRNHKREIGIITRELIEGNKRYVAERAEIHGITRTRVARILDSLETDGSIPIGEIISPPSILEEVKAYLSRHGITDRLTYHVGLFDHEEGAGVARWYNNCKIRGLFPWNLLQLVRGKKNRQSGNPLRKELLEAGDILYGPLNREHCTQKLREAFAAAGISSREQLLAADYRQQILPVVEASPFRSMHIVMEVFGDSEPPIINLTYPKRKELLAKILFGS